MRRYVFALVAATIVAIIAPMIWLQIGGEPAPAPNREAPIDTAEDVEAEAALGGAIAALDKLTRAIRKGDLRQVPAWSAGSWRSGRWQRQPAQRSHD